MRQENTEFQNAYYQIKETLDSERARLRSEIDQLKRDLEQALNLKTKQEKDLTDRLRTRDLELQTLRTEYTETQSAAEARITALQEGLRKSNTEGEVALERLNDAQAKLHAEQQRTEDLTRQVAALNVDAQTLNGRIAALDGDLGQVRVDLAAEREAHQATRQNADQVTADLAAESASLAQAQEKIATLEAQVQGAQADLKRNETLQAEKDKLAGDLAQATGETEKLRQQLAEAQKAAEAMSLERDAVLVDAAARLTQNIDTLPDHTGIELHMEQRGMRIILPSDLLFDQGSTVLSDRAAAVLETVGAELSAQADRRIVIEGHTDNQPIKDMPFADNWGLGLARADRVRAFLMNKSGLAGANLTTLSRAQFAPLGDNNTPEGRTRNRRVEIIVGEESK